MAGGADRLHHLEDALAHTRLADLVVGSHQLESLALDQRILHLLKRSCFLASTLLPAARHGPAGERIGGHFGRRSTRPARRAPSRTRRACSSRCGWNRARTSGSAGRLDPRPCRDWSGSCPAENDAGEDARRHGHPQDATYPLFPHYSFEPQPRGPSIPQVRDG